MCNVSSLKSLSLRVLANFVWDALKTKSSESTTLEQTLGIQLTNFMNGLDDCSFHIPFLNFIKKIARVFQNVFNADLLVNSLWNNFKMKPPNLETTLNQLNEYLSLPTSLKLELARILSTQQDSCNLFQMALMIEMGYHHLNFQDYLHLTEDLTFINLLKFGKKSIKDLRLSQWKDNRVTSIPTQEFLLTSFPYLQHLHANGRCCNDYTLCLVAKYCLHLKRLDVGCAHRVTDQGVKFLCSPQSAAKQLEFLRLYHTKVTAKGAENALKHLARLESLECSNDKVTIGLLKSLSEQELVFDRYKEITMRFTEKTEERYKCKDLIRKLPLIFPNLRNFTIRTNVYIEPECLLLLRSLSKIEKLELVLYNINASWSLFPCDNNGTNFHEQMNNLTDLRLRFLDYVCIHSVLDSAPSLRYLTIQDVFDSGCTHEQAVITYPSVSHLALIGMIGDAVVGKCMGLCPIIKTLALICFDEMQSRIKSLNVTNLTHLSLVDLKMETAEFLVKNCKSLQVLNLTNQLPISEEAVWFQRHSPFVKVMNYGIGFEADWFEYECFSP